jgi:predicted DNA binding CopG/RHH family protein
MKKKLTRTQKSDLAALAALPDSQIDTSDIPEIRSLAGGVRGLFYRPDAEPITIQLSTPEVATARRLSKNKDVPYQAYINMLLHEALERANTAERRSARRR